ncbi:iron-containing alcohol dehydrogenase [Thermosphaera aggregans]|jgi:alcohol dehydrogenase class IV|uniref:Iron-containing alcohol dehydrogenase n=1 Tax=Thermosphaera aggregans (strain DSM 11486 / M11TL) TaxID=633148 RepID=D5U0U6_THEAM|nr:iron-containing alcohol dehydrogenase [Thermosphaera aggregans]ADG90746.1 iron-containing alcohol dehydrogenase [Thermosphaera aggregans DSM 11486]
MVTPLKKFKLRYADATLFFGEKSIADLEAWVRGKQIIGLVMSRSAAKTSGALQEVLEILTTHNIVYVPFNDVTPNPSASQAVSCAELFRKERVDSIIAIGGGSVIDVGKTVSLLINSNLSPSDLVKGVRAEKAIPLAAVNLTHGTGSEIDRYAVLTFEETGEKRGFTARYPEVSIDDPRFTLTLSRDQTLFTSLDAFYHAYESATSSYTNMFVQTLSSEAAEIIANNLPETVENLKSIEHRSRLLYASMIAGISIDIALTHLNHALEHAFSGLNPNLPHGEGLAILGPRIIYHVHKAVPEDSAVILKHLDPSIRPVAEDAEKAYTAVKEFQRKLGLERKLSDYGFGPDDIPSIVSYTMKMIKERYKSTPLIVNEDVIKDIILDAL